MDDKRISPDRKKKLPIVGTDPAGSGENKAAAPLLIRALEIKGSGTSSRKAASSSNTDAAKKPSSAKKPVASGKPSSVKKPAASGKPSSTKKPVTSKKPASANKSVTSAKKPAAHKTESTAKPAKAGKAAPTSKPAPDQTPATTIESAPLKAPASTREETSSAPEEVLSTDLSTLDPILESGAGEISVPLCAENIRAFSKYARLLKEWNEKMNLTNITDDKGIALRHFVDSLTLVSFLEAELKRKGLKELSLIDVGTGAGFPGIPLKVALPWLQVTLLDSLRKRVGFLDAVCTELELSGIGTVHSRAEDAGRSKQYREKFDVATARAVAPLPILCEYCLPFVKVGGIFLAMKGNADREAEDSNKAIVTLGGTIEDLRHFTLPGTDMNRSIIVIRKVRQTPPKYPRQAGKPEKEPIV